MRAGKDLLDPIVETLQHYGYPNDSARAQAYQAVATAALGQYNKAFNQVMNLIEQAKKIKHYSVETLLAVFTVVVRIGADWQNLLKVALSCNEFSQRSGNKIYGPPTLAFAGWSEAHLGRHESAAEYFTQAFALARAAGNRVLLIDWMEAANAERHLLAGESEVALTLARDLAERSHNSQLVLSEGIAERVWGCALSRLEAPLEEVESHLQRSLQIHRESGNIVDTAQTEQWWGRISRERGDESAAQQHFSLALAVFEAAGCDYAADSTRKEAAKA